VDKKMNRTPAEGETVTPEAKADIKNALIGAGVIVTLLAVPVLVVVRATKKAVLEDEESASDETTED
jgi:hypothetical protein